MKTYDDNDEFWSLDDMLPPSVSKKLNNKSESDVSTVEILIEGEKASPPVCAVQSNSNEYPPITSSGGQKINYSEWLSRRNEYFEQQKESKRVVEREYEPKNPLIRKVTVSSDINRRPFKERFLTDAEALYELSGSFEGDEPYYAIFPQYATMNERQKSCYIGFRTCVRQGIYPQVSEGYITLLLFEIINLSDKSTPKEMAQSLASLICGYPDVSDKLFLDMCNYLADVCLIYSLEIPEKIFGKAYPRVLKSARIKELFIKSDSESSVGSLLAGASRYDFRTSKFYPENKEYYDRYIEKSVALAIEHIARTDSRFRDDKSETFKLEYESFFGAYRTQNAKKHISLKLAFITRDDEVKRVVSELTKYAENCLRSTLMIKPRLTVNYVSREVKGIIKKYILDNTASIKPVSAKRLKIESKPELPEYEKLYEPKQVEASLENALRIEESSWQITDKLIAAFEGTDDPQSQMIAPESPQIAIRTTQNTDNSVDLNGLIIKGLAALYNNKKAEFFNIAKQSGMLSSAFIDKINEFLLDEIGDIGLEENDGNIEIASWYAEDIQQIIENYLNLK